MRWTGDSSRTDPGFGKYRPSGCSSESSPRVPATAGTSRALLGPAYELDAEPSATDAELMQAFMMAGAWERIDFLW